jgi:hypothetical protein
MSRFRAFAVLVGLSATLSWAAPASAQELTKLRALLVIDPEVHQSGEADRDTIKALLLANIPPDRLELEVYEGTDACRDKIRRFFGGPANAGQEAALLYISAHGAIRPSDREHVIQLTGQSILGRKAELIDRSDLRALLTARNPGLAVLLTDACSNYEPGLNALATPRGAKNPPAQVAPGFRKLFFLSRGLVDINGSTEGHRGWADEQEGGLFTRSLGGVLSSRKGDPTVSWNDAYLKLRFATEDAYKEYKPRELQRGGAARAPGADEEMKALTEQKTQSPQAYKLPENSLGLVLVGLGGGVGVRVRSVLLDSPAQKAGLRLDDNITDVNGQAVGTVADWNRVTATATAGSGASLRLKVRGSDKQDRVVVLQVP